MIPAGFVSIVLLKRNQPAQRTNEITNPKSKERRWSLRTGSGLHYLVRLRNRHVRLCVRPNSRCCGYVGCSHRPNLLPVSVWTGSAYTLAYHRSIPPTLFHPVGNWLGCYADSPPRRPYRRGRVVTNQGLWLSQPALWSGPRGRRFGAR